MADATKLTVPVTVLGSLIAVAVGGTMAYGGITGGVEKLGERMTRMEARLTAVEANTNSALNQQGSANQTLAIMNERQNAQNERMTDLAARLLSLEAWQRAVNARPTP